MKKFVHIAVLAGAVAIIGAAGASLGIAASHALHNYGTPIAQCVASAVDKQHPTQPERSPDVDPIWRGKTRDRVVSLVKALKSAVSRHAEGPRAAGASGPNDQG